MLGIKIDGSIKRERRDDSVHVWTVRRKRGQKEREREREINVQVNKLMRLKRATTKMPSS